MNYCTRLLAIIYICWLSRIDPCRGDSGLEIGRDTLAAYLALCFVVGLVLGLLVIHPLLFRSQASIGHPVKVMFMSPKNGNGLLVSYDGRAGFYVGFVYNGTRGGWQVSFSKDYGVITISTDMPDSSLRDLPNMLTFTVTIKDASGNTIAYGSRTLAYHTFMDSGKRVEIKLSWTGSPDPSKIYEIDVSIPEPET